MKFKINALVNDFTSEAIWASTFLYGKVFNYKFYFLNRYRASEVLYFF